MKLRLVPIDISRARAWIQREHSHLDAPIGGKCAVAVEVLDGGGWRMCCVALLGRPVSRELQTQGCAEVLRVASDRTPHAASKALAAITRAGLALGYRRLVSSTLLGEAGTSYTAAGWHPVHVELRSRDWERSDGRSSGPAMQPGAKVRWESGPDALASDPRVEALVRDCAGRVELRGRQERLPLFAKLPQPEAEGPCDVASTEVSNG
jgi:hypothetical protein